MHDVIKTLTIQQFRFLSDKLITSNSDIMLKIVFYTTINLITLEVKRLYININPEIVC